ncbi:tubulin C-terminal domain-like protein, partial [Aspergillus uvarum CBS 121591]
DNVQTALCSVPAQCPRVSATLHGNSTAIQEILDRVDHAFARLFHFKAVLHWYIGEGMEELDFVKAASNLHDLVAEYRHYRYASEAGFLMGRVPTIRKYSSSNK